MSSARTRTCQWCGTIADTVTAHMIHLHEEHPETIGRGPTMSREWSCACGHKNRPVTAICEVCGTVDHDVLTANENRRFVVWYRMTPGDDPAISDPIPLALHRQRRHLGRPPPRGLVRRSARRLARGRRRPPRHPLHPDATMTTTAPDDDTIAALEERIATLEDRIERLEHRLEGTLEANGLWDGT